MRSIKKLSVVGPSLQLQSNDPPQRMHRSSCSGMAILVLRVLARGTAVALHAAVPVVPLRAERHALLAVLALLHLQRVEEQ